MSSDPILPGATLGVIGGGQLGRMFAQVANQMGYRVITLGPGADSPAAQVAQDCLDAAYDDPEALEALATQAAAVTVEFENVPVSALEALEGRVPVRPGPEALRVCQHRLREKTFLSEHGYPVTPFRALTGPEGLIEALTELGGDAVLKTAGFGYDGKGQARARLGADPAACDPEALWAAISGDTPTEAAVLEQFVSFAYEMSVIGVRGTDGSFNAYGPIHNEHHHHILDISLLTDEVSPLAHEAHEITRGVMTDLGAVGVLCVEFFVTSDGRLLVNEMAPRPHNSGHLTIEGCVTSQFEQQVRALCGLPLGDTALVRPAAGMANLLGDLWLGGEPRWAAALSEEVKLHLYGKGAARPGRKMGHLTCIGASGEAVKGRLEAARQALNSGAISR